MDFNLTEMPVIVCIMQVSNINPEVLFDTLDEQEKVRALRFRQSKDYERFVAAHSLKRAILGKCLNVSPCNLTFGLGAHGKPFCCHPEAPYFNISHSGDWVVVAVSQFSEIGVDIEFTRDVNYQELVGRVCSASQIKQFETAKAPNEMFLLFWTQKEAVAKACGKGISVGLPDISCSGRICEDELTFLQQHYWLWTHPWRDGGALTVAASSGNEPKYFIVTQFDGFHFSLQYDEMLNC